MPEIVLTPARNVRLTGLRRCLGLLTCTIVAVSIAGCGTAVAPATPQLLSIKGHGEFSGTPDFRFYPPTWDAATNTTTYHIGTTVRFTVPYPTSIELDINGKPLTKSGPPLSRNYEYAARIEDPVANPATWSVDILTPFDVPYAEDKGGQAAYVLSIVDVSGSNRSQPLKIYYRQPQAFVPRLFPGAVSSTTSTNPTGASRPTGPCSGGGQEQSFTICWRKSGDSPYSAGTTACSYSEAVRLLQNSYPGYSSSAGACP